MMRIVTLKKNEDRRIREGHLWAFSNEIHEVKGNPQAGDLVELRSHAGAFLGVGMYHPHSLIAVRILTRREEEIDFQFFRKRIEAAHALRKKIYPDSDTFRLVHGESDFLPGLIIDKYNQFLSVQTFSFGMDRRLTLICDVLESLFQPKGIIERDEIQARSLEQLEQKKGILRGKIEPLTISENGIKYSIELLEGQKTGFFLDQRENRKAIRRYGKGVNMLDCFCNDGGFSLNAAFAEAANVTAVDVSESSIHHAVRNASLNSLSSNTNFLVADAFDFLHQCMEKNITFDLVNLDPPSFTKSRKTVFKAARGYKELHDCAFRLLTHGGILATASCSHHITEEKFYSIVNESARAAGRTIKLLERHGAAPDHPVLLSMPETAYLKFGIFQVE